MTYDALLLTGGRGRRLGGADKAALAVGGVPMGQRAARAVADASLLIVVGPRPVGLDGPVVETREDPPGTGPVAAIAAGLHYAGSPEVIVLAADQPFVTAVTVQALRTARLTADADVAFPVDDLGEDQPLCAAWRSDGLRAALAGIGDPSGVSVRRLIGAAGSVARVQGLADRGEPPPWFDCDTLADLAQAEGWT